MLNPEVKQRAARSADEFSRALPFRHLCIDDFFEDSVAEGLLKEFPGFASDKALNEIGEVGQKAVFEKLSDIGPFYAAVARYLASDDLPSFLTRVTGIPGLLWGGESMYGGGTHENLEGIDLDAHVDFNYDDRTRLHRRLNVLVYLNREWDDAWGGALELHSDPRDPAHNYVKTFSPLFNRCVIFETNEHSWHGFPRIVLPSDKKHLSRKSLAMYFYTKDRPGEEIVGGHTTFYVQRPIPATVRPGEILSPDDYALVHHLVYKRDVFIKLYQEKQVRDGEQNAQLQQELARERATREVHIDDASARLLVTTLGGRVARGVARRARSVLRRIPGARAVVRPARALRRRLLGP
jgi:2-oxoglutarate-Fe(II)-dependent oxygenase superfamily protein